MNHTTDANLLRELACKSASESAFAINTNDLQGAAERLRAAASYLDRLILATGKQGLHTNAGGHSNEFARYDLNNPGGEESGALLVNKSVDAGTADSFARYDLNAPLGA